MLKIIEKIEQKKAQLLEKEIEKLNKQRKEARDWFNDTGYDRYQNKIDKIDAELEEIEQYKNKDILLADERSKLNDEKAEIEKQIVNIKNKVFYLLADCPDNIELQQLQKYLDTL